MEQRETVYEHIYRDKRFKVYAAERWSVSMAKKLLDKYPDDVTLVEVNEDGNITISVPLEWMRVIPKRKSSISGEALAEATERLVKFNTKTTKEDDK